MEEDDCCDKFDHGPELFPLDKYVQMPFHHLFVICMLRLIRGA